MKKAIFAILFFLGFIFANLNYAKADVPAFVCSSNASYPVGHVERCGLLPNFCKGCDLYNEVVDCTADASGHLPATIDKNTCKYVEDLPHEKKSSKCAETPACKPPPVCQTITCFDVDNAGGTCDFSGRTPNSNIAGCTATCPGTGKKVPGFTVSACQTDNCFYNDCTCYPNAGACETPTPAPNLSCPVPPAVKNVRVECPYCL